MSFTKMRWRSLDIAAAKALSTSRKASFDRRAYFAAHGRHLRRIGGTISRQKMWRVHPLIWRPIKTSGLMSQV